jgi:2-haloacid dehalogenase
LTISPPPIRALTFDCYGTLIDWETGILKALRPLLSIHGISRERASDAELLRLYSQFEPEIQSAAGSLDAEPGSSHMLYRDVLREVVARFGDHFKLRLAERELDRLPDSIPAWPAFADTPAALARLAAKFTLAIVSNIDDDLFAGTLPHLHGDSAASEPPAWPHWIITAQYCRSYKPNPRHFRVALALLGLEPSHVLHVAQSRFHDIAPAKALGLRTAWINRRSSLPGTGATPPAEARADVEYADLKSLADALDA